MCTDISYNASSTELLKEHLPDLVFQPQIEFDFTNSIHVLAHAFRKYPVIIMKNNIPSLEYFEWGLIARYMNTPEAVKQYRSSMVNAKSEKLLDDKKSVWYQLRNNRCLIPVTGFFEHREIKGWKNKVPYYITLKEPEYFFLLGIYNYSPNPNVETGEISGTFSLLTRPSNDLMTKIHNHGPNKHRMPVIHQPEAAVKFIHPNLSEVDIRNMMQFEIPSDSLDACPVFSIRTTKQRPDGNGKVDAYNWEGLPPLGSDDQQLSLL